MSSLAKTAVSTYFASGRWTAFTSLLAPAMKAHAPLLILVAIQALLVIAIYAATPELEAPDPAMLGLSFISIVGIILPLSVISMRFFRLATKVRPKHPLPALVRDVWDFARQPDRMANGLPVVVVFIVFTTLFTYVKGAIPLIAPFSWDPAFAAWDRWLHFGTDPWKLLAPFLNYAPVTVAVTGMYHLWFMVMWVVVGAFAFAKVLTALRMRFLLAFMLAWIVGGNLLAIVFSSAGPCYYGLLGYSPDPFAPLMAYLHNVHEAFPLWAVDTQILLWRGYQGEAFNFGISAMPSMHNGAALLFALTGWCLNRKLGIALFAFTAVVFVGSVHLGWHYAIDAYAGFAVALAAWWLAGIIATWWEKTRWAREYAVATARLS